MRINSSEIFETRRIARVVAVRPKCLELYGVDARLNVGFALWQLAYCSKAPLTSDSYGAARAALGSIRGDNGQPLDINPNLLVVPPNLEGSALTVLNAEIINNTTNIWRGTATVLKTARVA